MNGEVENNENKKKQKVAIIVGVVTLLIAVLGATYAFFQISTDTNSSNTTITGSTPANGLVTLKGVTSNLHLNISASDMAFDNMGIEYYATDVEGKAYEDNEKDGTKTIAEVELTGGDATTRYSCTAKLTVSKVTEPEEERDTIVDVLQPGDMILQFKGNVISEQLDLSELQENNPKEYNLNFKISGDKPEAIQAYIELLNKDEPQNYLAGKKLNIDISTSDLKCDVYIPDPKIAYLREKSDGKLTEDLVYGLYRYQGNATVNSFTKDEDGYNITSVDRTYPSINNYICLGSDCSSEESQDMYRIIGINEDGEIKVVKSTPLSEKKQYNYGDNVSLWDDSSLYQYLNDDFYNSLSINLREKIKDTKWSYSDLSMKYFADDAQERYGKLGDELSSATTDEEKRPIIRELSQLDSNAVIAGEKEGVKDEIGLISKTDYCSSFESNNDLNCYTSSYVTKLENPVNNDFGLSWMSPDKDGEYWIICNPFAVESNTVSIVSFNGFFEYDSLSNYNSVYPVFYLTSDIELTDDGEGTIENPFRVVGIE